MRNKNNPLIVKILILTAMLCFSVSAMAADPAELVRLRHSFESEKSRVSSESGRRDLVNNYIQQLTDLATDLRIYKNDREGTNAVRHEIRNAKKELEADLSLPKPEQEPTKAQAPPRAEPEPVPVDKLGPTVTESATKPEPGSIPELTGGKFATKPGPEPAPLDTRPEARPAPRPQADTPVTTPIAKPMSEPEPPKVNTAPKTKSAPAPVSSPAETETRQAPKRVSKPQPESAARKRAPEPEPKPAPKPVVTNAVKPAATPVPAIPAPKPVVKKAAPKPQPVPAEEKKAAPPEKHSPQTHVSSEQGLAGPPGVNGKNVYTFELPGIGETTTLAFWATGKESLDSYGKVWLITPEGRRNILGIWKESYLDKPSTEVYSYYNLKPIAEDITRKVTTPGTYKVEFEWTNGKDPLVIYRVEITS